MEEPKRFAVIELPQLTWPTGLELPGSRFRLFVAADSSDSSADSVSEFASAALNEGMVYCCVWGPACERFHDIVDEIVIKDDLSERKFVGPTPNDTIMTTWHDNESLEEALDFFATSAVPTDGFTLDSTFRLAICVGNPAWTVTAKQFLESAQFFV